MSTIRFYLDKSIAIFCVFIFIFMTIVGTYQITSRYFFNSPSTISEELITYSFAWLSLLAASYVFGQRGHLCMSFVYSKFVGKSRVVLDMLSEITIAFVALFLFIYGGQYMAFSNLEQVTASLGVNMGVIYAVLPISGAIILIYNILNLFDLYKLFVSDRVSEYGKREVQD